MALESCVPLGSSKETPIQGGLTPLHHSAWEAALRDHPDRLFAEYICTGLRVGFRIGFARSKPLRDTTCNMFSASQHPEPIAEYLMKELGLNQMLGPFDDIDGRFQFVHVSRFGIIPKGYNTGKWRLITYLSYPPGNSVNDGIDPSLCSLHYTSMEDMAMASGSGPAGPQLIVSQGRHRIGVSPHTGPSWGPLAAWYEMGEPVIHQSYAPLRAAVGTQNLQCYGRRVGMASKSRRHTIRLSLPRFCSTCGSGFRRVLSSGGEAPPDVLRTRNSYRSPQI